MKTYQNNQLSTTQNDTLKTTALLYLREALLNESYEDCRELIQEAETFGAGHTEISGIFADYFQTFQTGSNGAKSKSRLY